MPCAGERCPFCAANDNPKSRALTAWYFPDNDVKDQIKLFTMNFTTLSEVDDEAEEEGGILGKKVRLKRLSDDGKYRVKILTEKPLTKAQLDKAFAALEELFPDGIRDVVMRQLAQQMKRLRAMSELDDDDDDEDEDDDRPAARRGRATSKVEEADDEEDEEDEEADEEADEEEEDGEEEEDADEEEEEADDEEEDEEEADEEVEEETVISGAVFTVLKIDDRNETIELRNDDGKVKMWVGEGVNPDYDEIPKGTQVSVDAETDDEGDWIIVAIAPYEEPKPKRSSSTAKRSSAKSGSKTSTTKRGTTKTRSRK